MYTGNVDKEDTRDYESKKRKQHKQKNYKSTISEFDTIKKAKKC